jgi:hypothetical protein
LTFGKSVRYLLQHQHCNDERIYFSSATEFS